MNTKRITLTLTVAILAVATLAIAAAHTAVGVDGLIGFGAVIALIAVAATDYRNALPRGFGSK